MTGSGFATASTIVVGTGYTGTRLLRRLPENAARGLSRSAPAHEGGPPIDIANLDAPPPRFNWARPFDIVYTVPPAKDSDEDRRLVTFLAALAEPPRRLVYLSTTGVYGNRDGAIVTETSKPRPTTARARRRLHAEAAVTAYASDTGTAAVILRIPGIYGPDRLMIERLRERSPLIADAESGPGNRIHVDDLVTACLAALCPEVPPGIFNVGDGDHRSSTWFATTVARLLGMAPPPTVSREEAQTTFSGMRLSFLNESRQIDTQKMRSVLGVEPRYANAESGIRASLADMGLIDPQ